MKRYLRRERINELLENGQAIPPELTSTDVGFNLALLEDGSSVDASDLDRDIDYHEGQAMIRLSRTLERETYRYWMLEYIARRTKDDPAFTLEALVLGCVEPRKKRYAVYLPELGFEEKYTSKMGYLNAGERLQLAVESVSPRNSLITLTLANP